MMGVTHLHHQVYLEAVGVYFNGSDIRGPEGHGYQVWLRIPTPRGHVALSDAQELGERGLAVQAFEFADAQENDPNFFGEIAWIGERAPVQEAVIAIRGYLASPNVRHSYLEQRQL